MWKLVCPGRWLAAALLAAGTKRAADPPQAEVVVAMRYPQQTGTSHAHLYLYRADGKLLRQLTNDNGGQDGNPVFSPDGSTIVFTRELPGGVKQCWSIEPRGGALHQIVAPDWYAQAKSSPSYEHIFNGAPIVREPRPAPTDARAITSPDGKTEIKIVPAADVEDPGAPDRWDVQLCTTDGGQPVKVGELSGYSAGFLSRVSNDAGQCLLHDGELEVAFCFVHLNSTDGNTVHALDLRTRRLTRLSPNLATPFLLPGEPAFLTLTENRYVPYGDGEHTANCFYVERWGVDLKPVRYAKGKTAGVCYGASMYRPAKSPAVICIEFTEP